MFRTLLKLAVIGLIAYGVYAYVFDGPKFETSDLPAVSYEEISQKAGEVKDVLTEEDADSQDDQVEDEETETVGDEGTTTTKEPVEETAEESEETEEEAETEEQAQDNTADIPVEFNLAVPFTPQAPHANWDLPYQEACEEASAYMVAEYYNGTPAGLINPDVADAAILDLVDFQTDFFGYYLDTTAGETARFIDAFYGLRAVVVNDPTVEMIKREVAAGRPVIVPAAGRQLNNPNFTGEGPLYHMLVIKGYTEDSFVTNDPGTRNGRNYVYDMGVIMDAMGDWNDGDPASGAKRVIFVSP